jgi:hypothetical protein
MAGMPPMAVLAAVEVLVLLEEMAAAWREKVKVVAAVTVPQMILAVHQHTTLAVVAAVVTGEIL